MDKFKQKLAQKLTEKGYIIKKASEDAFIITIALPDGNVGTFDTDGDLVILSDINVEDIMKFNSEEKAYNTLVELETGLLEIQKLSDFDMDKISSKKQASFWEVKKNENGKYYLTSPKGDYKDAEGKVYEFDTETDALEEIDFLDAEHKYKKELKHKKADYDKIKVGIEGNSLTLGINDYLKLDTEESSDNTFQNEQEKQNFEKKVVTRLIPYLSELKRKFIEIVRLEGIDLVNKNASKKEATIKYEDGVYNVYSENGRCLGKDYKTKEEAEKRLKQVEYFKNKEAELDDIYKKWYLAGYNDCKNNTVTYESSGMWFFVDKKAIDAYYKGVEDAKNNIKKAENIDYEMSDDNEFVIEGIQVVLYSKGNGVYDIECFNANPDLELEDVYEFFNDVNLGEGDYDNIRDNIYDFLVEKGII